ncbi:MAG: Hpt domain-containing protein [Proteobacteria bacterium]|nr:MAG: Hpt domain-containing protein [Pseudomonadota bacterium]
MRNWRRGVVGEKIIVKIDPDLEDLIPGFLHNRAKDVRAINDLLDTQDFDAIRLLGHSMKGAGGGYGFDLITEIGDRIEVGALAADTAMIREANAQLDDYLSRVEPVCES